MRRPLVALALALAVPAVQGKAPHVPTIDDIIGLERPGGTAVSPDGRRVLFTVTQANWDENAYETEIFVADAAGGPAVQLTRARKSSGNPA